MRFGKTYLVYRDALGARGGGGAAAWVVLAGQTWQGEQEDEEEAN